MISVFRCYKHLQVIVEKSLSVSKCSKNFSDNHLPNDNVYTTWHFRRYYISFLRICWSIFPHSLKKTWCYSLNTHVIKKESSPFHIKFLGKNKHYKGWARLHSSSVVILFLGPTSLIVYNFSDPVTSLYIYEMSSSDLITRSFLAGDEYVIKTSPVMTHHDMGKLFSRHD